MRYNAVEAIIESYSIFIRQKDVAGDEDISARKKQEVVGASRSCNVVCLADNNGKSYKLRLPNPIINAKQDRGGRTSTTFRVASLTEAGHIIAAAESNPRYRHMQIMWGRYAYQDNPDIVRQRQEGCLSQYVATKYVISLAKRPSKRLESYYILGRYAVKDYLHRSTSGQSRYKAGELAKAIDVSVENYINNYKKHYDAMITIIQDRLDKPFLQPIKTAISQMLADTPA